MGTISTGIGLISGLDINKIVGQLIALERRPGDLLQKQIDGNKALRDALQSLSVSLVSANLAVSRLSLGGAFAGRKASSSSDTLAVTAGAKAPVGSYAFTPKQLATTQQLISAGFASATSTLGNTGPTTLSIAPGGFVDAKTQLSNLGGGAGVAPGSIRVTNGANSAIIDLSGAITAQDVVDAINGATGLGVTAKTDGDRFSLTAGGGGAVTVENVGGASTATDLGLTNLTLTAGVNYGQQVYKLGNALSLGALNDGNGVRQVAGADFRVTVDGSTNYDIELSGTKTVGDVLAAINSQTSGAVTGTLVNGSIQLTGGTTSLAVSSLGGSLAASDLGIAGTGGTTLTGRNVLGGLNSVLLESLRGGYNGGADLVASRGTLSISGAGAANIDLSGAATLDAVVAGINGAAATTGVTATVNRARNGIDLSRAGGGSFTVADVSGNLASFLNIAGTATAGALQSGDLDRKYISENTRLDSLNFGQGISRGKFKVTDGLGNSGIVDLTQESDVTLADVITEINTRPGVQVSARINDTGDGILIQNLAGSGSVSIAEEGGQTAKSLGILVAANGSGNVDGSLQKNIAVLATDTLSSIVTKINEAGAGVTASILNTGIGANPYRLSLTSAQAGLAGAALVDAGTTALAFATNSQARDAVLLYGSGVTPLQLTSRTGRFTDAVPGLTVDLKGTSPAPVTVTVTQDEDGVVGAVKSFVESVNQVLKFVAENSNFNTETDERGVLFTENSARTGTARVNRFLSQAFRDTGSKFVSLGQLGIRFDGTKGEVVFDEASFRAKYQTDQVEVEKFFGEKTNGVAKKFSALVDELTGDEGVFTSRVENLADQITKKETSLEQFNARIDLKQTRLFNQFYNLELTLANLQSQQSALTQLANLATNFTQR